MSGPPRWVPGSQNDGTAGLWRCFLKRTVSNREQVRAAFSLSPDREAVR